jgi:hypothetical protein
MAIPTTRKIGNSWTEISAYHVATPDLSADPDRHEPPGRPRPSRSCPQDGRQAAGDGLRSAFSTNLPLADTVTVRTMMTWQRSYRLATPSCVGRSVGSRIECQGLRTVTFEVGPIFLSPTVARHGRYRGDEPPSELTECEWRASGRCRLSDAKN